MLSDENTYLLAFLAPADHEAATLQTGAKIAKSLIARPPTARRFWGRYRIICESFIVGFHVLTATVL